MSHDLSTLKALCAQRPERSNRPWTPEIRRAVLEAFFANVTYYAIGKAMGLTLPNSVSVKIRDAIWLLGWRATIPGYPPLYRPTVILQKVDQWRLEGDMWLARLTALEQHEINSRAHAIKVAAGRLLIDWNTLEVDLSSGKWVGVTLIAESLRIPLKRFYAETLHQNFPPHQMGPRHRQWNTAQVNIWAAGGLDVNNVGV